MVVKSVLIQNSALTEQAKAAIILEIETRVRTEFVGRFNIPFEDVRIRQAEPDEDLGFADTAQISGALVADAETDYVARDIRNLNTVVGFYAINNLSANPLINRVRFKTGTSPGSGTKASYYLEGLYANAEPKGYLENPVMYAGEQMLIRVEASATVGAPGERLILEGVVAEQAGDIITE